MTRPLILTAAWLRQHNACPEDVAEFRRLFGEAAEVCPETLDMTAAAGLSVVWLGGEVLTAAAQAEYRRVVAAAWAKCRRVVDPAQAEYRRVVAAAQAESRRVAAAAWAALLADPANWKPEVLAELRGDV